MKKVSQKLPKNTKPFFVLRKPVWEPIEEPSEVSINELEMIINDNCPTDRELNDLIDSALNEP